MFFELLCLALLVGLSSSSTTVVVRLIWPFKGWTEAGIKPWVCDFCMSFWTVLAYSAVLMQVQANWRYLFIGLPSYAVALYSLRRLTDPASAPPTVESLQALLDSGYDANAEKNEDVRGET